MFGVSPKKKRKRKPKETVVDGVTIKVNPGKFKNQITNGYHSKKEYERSLILKDMLAKGEISNLREQVSYELIPKQPVHRPLARPRDAAADHQEHVRLCVEGSPECGACAMASRRTVCIDPGIPTQQRQRARS
jgi:hypothetical protein